MGNIVEITGLARSLPLICFPLSEKLRVAQFAEAAGHDHILTAADPDCNLTSPSLPNKISKGDQNLVKNINLSAHLEPKAYLARLNEMVP
jgi:hypothetical protein